MKQAKIMIDDTFAGILTEDDTGFIFTYDLDYLKSQPEKAVSLSLPLQEDPFKADHLFPFFDGLIPEGWLLSVVEKNWKGNSKDRMGLLLATCKDCIGNISVLPI